jgi:hypothetical protein
MTPEIPNRKTNTPRNPLVSCSAFPALFFVLLVVVMEKALPRLPDISSPHRTAGGGPIFRPASANPLPLRG